MSDTPPGGFNWEPFKRFFAPVWWWSIAGMVWGMAIVTFSAFMLCIIFPMTGDGPLWMCAGVPFAAFFTVLFVRLGFLIVEEKTDW